MRGHEGAVTRCCYVNGGSVLASSGSDGSLHLWNARSESAGSLISSVKLHKSSGGILSMTPNRNDGSFGSHLITLGEDGVIKFVTTMKPAELARLTGHGGPVRHIAFSPKNANILASASDDGTVKVWDWTLEKQQRKNVEDQLHSGGVVATTVSKDGSIFATVSTGGDVKFWHANTATGNITTVKLESAAPQCAVFSNGSSPEIAARLYVDCDDNTLYFIDVPKAWVTSTKGDVALRSQAVAKFDGPTRNMCLSSDGKKLYVIKSPSYVIEVSASEGKVLRTIPAFGAYPLSITNSMNEMYVAFDKSIRVLDQGSGTPTIATCPDTEVSCILGPRLPKSQYTVLVCLWDGRIFALESGKNYVVPKYQPLKSAPILCAAYAPNERHVLLGKRDATITMIDTKTWTEVTTFVCNSPVTSIAVSSKSQLIIAGDALGKVYLLKYYRR